MKNFIGTQFVKASAMTRASYVLYRGWTLPADENGADDGYLVEYYEDRSKPNASGHDGYVTWVTKDQFDSVYRRAEGLSFGSAVAALKLGKRVSRAGWNGKGMWLFIIPGVDGIAKLRGHLFAEATEKPTFRDAIFMRTVDCQLVAWTASQSDVLADDWVINP